jgi:sugar/nucleoside kinase (ribokinase family)
VGNIGYADRLAARLATGMETPTIIRAGGRGAWLAQPGAPVVHVEALSVKAVDTNGAGDVHTGVLAAGLARGLDLEPAARRACVAAALSVTRPGPSTAPTGAETDAAMTLR